LVRVRTPLPSCPPLTSPCAAASSHPSSPSLFISCSSAAPTVTLYSHLTSPAGLSFAFSWAGASRPPPTTRPRTTTPATPPTTRVLIVHLRLGTNSPAPMIPVRGSHRREKPHRRTGPGARHAG